MLTCFRVGGGWHKVIVHGGEVIKKVILNDQGGGETACKKICSYVANVKITFTPPPFLPCFLGHCQGTFLKPKQTQKIYLL